MSGHLLDACDYLERVPTAGGDLAWRVPAAKLPERAELLIIETECSDDSIRYALFVVPLHERAIPLHTWSDSVGLVLMTTGALAAGFPRRLLDLVARRVPMTLDELLREVLR